MFINYNLNRKVTFANQTLGDGLPCFIVYEAGPTHNGLESAKELVKLAAEAGANAVKFQIFDPDKAISDKNQQFSYDVLVDRETGKTETVTESLYELTKRRCLSNNEWKEVKKVADDFGLAFFATVGFEEDIALLEELNCDSIKIASSDVNHLSLIAKAAKTGMCIQLDTGNSTLGEIEKAVEVIEKEGNNRIIIHQCPSGYPARIPSINLRVIETLRQMFDYPIAYSDHTPDIDMDIAALTLGANLIEKTITKDRTTRSVEHIFSLEPKEMASFIHRIRDVETAFGKPIRLMTDVEKEKRRMTRRSAHTLNPIKSGEKLTQSNIEFRRPGTGIQPNEIEFFLNRPLNRDIKDGELLKREYFE